MATSAPKASARHTGSAITSGNSGLMRSPAAVGKLSSGSACSGTTVTSNPSARRTGRTLVDPAPCIGLNTTFADLLSSEARPLTARR